MNTLALRGLFKKTTLFATAFVLAVSTLTAAVPFILSQSTNAAAIQEGYTWRVDNAADLKWALAEPTVSHITLDADIVTTESLVLSRSNVSINGNDKTITGPDLGGVWVSGGDNFGLKIYRASGIYINSLRVTGANAGIQVNGSEVTFTGHTNVSGNVFGGIELTKGTNVTETPVVNLLHNQGSFTFNGETTGKPALWATTPDAVINASVVSLTKATHIVNGQSQYYAIAANANITATNVSNGTTFASIQAAIDAPTTVTGNTIQLAKDVTLAQPVQLNKAVIFDGNNKTVTSNFDRIDNLQNAAIIVTAANAAVKNVTVTTNSTLTATTGYPTKPIGIVAYNANPVVITNVTLNNNLAGLIVAGAKVTVDGIHTSGNLWYGINVDKAGAVLTIKGTNSHDETTQIFVDDTWTGANVIDAFGKYEKVVSGRQVVYTLDVHAPVVESVNFVSSNSPVDGSRVKSGPYPIKVTINDGPTKSAVNFTNFEIRKDGVFKQQWAGGSSLTPSFSLNTAGYSEGDYTLRTYGRDNNGNTFDETVTFTVDTTPPQGSTTNSSSAQTYNPVVITLNTTEDINTPSGWNFVNPREFTKTVLQNESSTVQFTDLAGNAGSAPYAVTNIDTSVKGAIAPISRTTTTPIVSGFLAYNVDESGVDGVELDIYVDGTLYERTTVDGVWTLGTITLANNAFHRISVYPAGADPEVATALTVDSFTTTAPVFIVSVAEEQTDEGDPVTGPVAGQRNGGLPLTTFGAAQILGTNADSSNNTADDEQVEGISTLNTPAQAANTEANKGTFLGLGWYWWLLILAAIAAIAWWIVAAVRKRQAE